jgi:hypothetical protein
MAEISSVVGKIEPRSKILEGSGIKGVTGYSKGVKTSRPRSHARQARPRANIAFVRPPRQHPSFCSGLTNLAPTLRVPKPPFGGKANLGKEFLELLGHLPVVVSNYVRVAHVVRGCAPNSLLRQSRIPSHGGILIRMGYLGLCMTELTAPSKDRSFGTVPLHVRLYTQPQWGGALRRLTFGGKGIVMFIIDSDFDSWTSAGPSACACQSHCGSFCFPTQGTDRFRD